MPLTRLDHDAGSNTTDSLGQRLLPRTLRVLQDLTYTCPGDRHAISHAVHQARLAAGFPSCTSCPSNPDRSQDRLPGAARSLVTDDGVRGVYLNDLDRPRAGRWGAAFASLLWDAQPRMGRTESEARPTGRRGPVVVTGFDERPSSPDLMLGAVAELRRMGCQVMDLGQTSRPCFHFAVHHLNAAGGLYVTGAGCDPAWTGFHFAGTDALPLRNATLLRDLERRATEGVTRPTRLPGAHHPFHAALPYQAGLWKLFHALRPLHLVCGTASRILPRTLESLFRQLPCRLTVVRLPVRRRDLANATDPDLRLVGQATRDHAAHLGMVIDDDGERSAVLSDTGQLVNEQDLVRILVLRELHEHQAVRLVLEESRADSITRSLARLSRDCPIERATSDALPGTLHTLRAGLGVDRDQRVWFGGDTPTCDAIQTLAHVLQALSLSDTPLSELVAQASA